MSIRWFFVCVLCLVVTGPVQAQQESSGDCQVGSLAMNTSGDSASSGTPAAKQASITTATPATDVAPSTEAEQYVQDVIAEDGLHVVHFWAPWCPNSKRELDDGWASLVRNNPNVTFTFVTVWNDGESGTSTLEEYDLPERVTEVTQPDLGPSDRARNRRQSFLTHPVTWIPSTWIFHNNGELAFAMNYGEMEMATVQSLLDATRKDW
jgi:thiol-disulfide isomerase/thioredoxin